MIDKDAGAKCGSKEVPLAAYSKAGADAAFLAATAKASDADKLDGLDSAQLARVAWAGEITIATTVPAGGCTDVHAPTGLVDFNIPNAHFSVVVTPNRTPGPQEVLTFTGMIDRNFGAGAGAPAIRMCNPSDSAVELTSLSVGLAVLRVDLFG